MTDEISLQSRSWSKSWRNLRRISAALQTASGSLVLLLLLAMACDQHATDWVLRRFHVESIGIGELKMNVAQSTSEAQKTNGQAGAGVDLAAKALDENDPKQARAYLDQLRALLRNQEDKALGKLVQAVIPSASASTPSIGTLHLPNQGWIYVGLFDKDGQLKSKAPAVDGGSAKAVAGTGAKLSLTALVLVAEASATKDGDSCPDWQAVKAQASIDLANIEPPLTKVTASPSALRVERLASCPMAGDLSMVYALVDLPRERLLNPRLLP